MMSEKVFLKSHVVLSWRWKVYSDWKMLHLLAGHSRSLDQQLGKHGYQQLIAWLVAPEDDWLVPVERSDRLPGRLRTGTSGPKYGGALLWRTLNVSGWMLYSIRSGMHDQWRMASASVMWLADCRWKITCAAASSTDCTLACQHAHNMVDLSVYNVLFVYYNNRSVVMWMLIGVWCY